MGDKTLRQRNKKFRKRNEKHRRKESMKHLKSVRDLMMADQPPGLGIPYGNDVVGHQDQLVLLDDYDSLEDGRYDVGYDGTEYDETEDYDYEEDYEEAKEYDDENDYYDYDYEEGENEDNDENDDKTTDQDEQPRGRLRGDELHAGITSLDVVFIDCSHLKQIVM